MLILFR